MKQRRNRKKPQRKLDGNMRIKLTGLFGVVLLALAGLAIRITVINANSGDKYKKQVLTQSQQQYDSRIIPFKRGDIMDRNGTVLATSSKVYNVILDCKVLNSKEDYVEPTILALTQQLGIEEKRLREIITEDKTKNSQYQILKKQVSMDEKKKFESYITVEKDSKLTPEEKKQKSNVQGVWFEEDYLRNYPLKSLACDTIGFTFEGNIADWGMEGYYSSALNGVDGRKYGYFNQDSDVEQTIIEPVNGQNITSTIDVNIQQIIEKYIAGYNSAMSKGPFGTKGAANVGVIVANPTNGEILGMASSDPYDLNNPRDLTGIYTEPELAAMNDKQKLDALNKVWKNFCITDAYEPGSTVKPIVVAAALESNTISENETFACDGGQQVGTDYIKCSIWPEEHGTQTLGEVIQNSCNDGMMKIGKQMGAETFIRYQKIFNFGTRTGIDLPGEGTGILFSKEMLNPTELATSSFGQGFTCTMIQEMAGICSAINGGTYYKPHVVSKVTDGTGKTIKKIEPEVLKKTISADVSAQIREYMGMSIESGTSKHAKVEGYSMGGKTGTAQKLPRGNKKYLVSYVGFAPLDNPQVAIYVVVDEPNTDAQANSAYPQYIAQAVLSEALPYLNIFPDEETKKETELWEGFTGIRKQNTVAQEVPLVQEGVEDTNVPAPPQEEKVEEGGNTRESDGVTNEEAGITE